jgi:uncharacterized membrane protein YkvA (DUF1232 family)
LIARIKEVARRLKREVVALWLAARDPRTPLTAKIIAAGVTAYALSPVDLIPDFIPVLGLLDDLIIVPAGIWLALRLVPADLMEEFRTRAREIEKPVSRSGLTAILLIWAAALLWFCAWLFR